MLAIFAVSRCNATGHCEYVVHGVSAVIHLLCTIELTVQRHFRSILEHESSDRWNPLSERSSMVTRQVDALRTAHTTARALNEVTPSRVPAASVSLFVFTGQTDHQQIKNGEHDACNHDRVKITALLDGFDQSCCVFRLDHRARKHFLAEPSQNRTPERRPSQRHYAECGEVHPNDPAGMEMT